MRVGIDVGTTRTVVAAADRGNFPVASFESDTGDVHEWYPSLVAAGPHGLLYGLDAEACRGTRGYAFLPSLKRLLPESHVQSRVRIGEREERVLDLLTGYLAGLRRDLTRRSNVGLGRKDPVEAWVSVPANANNNQRFLTLEAFRRAGFEVGGVLNEPSAAGIEYVHRFGSRSGTLKKDHLAVYDLGGGTFDVSVIGYEDNRRFEVVTTEGITRLGGNDFDEVLFRLALEQAGRTGDPADPALFALLDECRERKEGLHPATRKVAVDLGVVFEDGPEVVVQVGEYYDRLTPLVARTLEALEIALGRLDAERSEQVGTLYLVGGACLLPLVSRLVRERYGRRVKRSPYPFSATAVGLAVAAARGDEIEMHERFTRHFGVWREAECGSRIVFDPIFAKDTLLPGPTDPPLVLTRSYVPAHNVGHFRYLECSRVTEDQQPAGDLNPWDHILFPLDPDLRKRRRLDDVEVHTAAFDAGQRIEERYECDARGVIHVTIENRSGGYKRTYELRSRATPAS